CRYQISGIDKEPRSIFGLTPLQANRLALKTISAEIVALMKSWEVVDGITGAPLTAELFQIGME
ncbi:MAG: hypothetical protein K0M78_02345, partial [Brevundimonas sp.]|nr:hypothetical protein [Brevundimonas sp.]